jgi:hypothetical protein
MPQPAENTAVFATQPQKRLTMTATLARRLAVGVLTIAVSGSPVLASVPTCCHAATATDRQACCCRQHGPAADVAAADGPVASRSCCAKHAKACCAAHQAAVVVSSVISSAKPSQKDCCCKLTRPLVGVPEDQTQSESWAKSIFSAGETLQFNAASLEQLAILPVRGQVDVKPGPPLQSLLCRWLV